MSRWFRHYAGMARDDKLVSVAIRSKQTVERVVWVWGAILESAAEIDDGGRYQIDHAEMAWFLRCDESDLAAIENALGNIGRVDQGRVARWADRQFQSDRSAERQKRYRDRQKMPSDHNGERHGDYNVTSPSRHGDAPETETETETEVEQENRNLAVSAKEPAGSKSPKGSRLSSEYELPELDRAFASSIGVPADQVERQFERFRDYWVSKPGKDGVKLDWSATWRNWIRKFADDRGFAPTAEPGAPQKPTSTTVTPGTAQWDAWYEFKRSTGTTRLMDAAQREGVPFPVPTDFPPSATATAA